MNIPYLIIIISANCVIQFSAKAQGSYASSAYPSLNIQFGEINSFDRNSQDDLHTIELRFKPITQWQIIPAVGYSWSTEGAKYLYSDVKYDFQIKSRWHLLISTGIGLYENSELIDLGHVIEFRSGLELAREMKNAHKVGVAIYHLSNSKLGSKNPGTESISVTYTFQIGA